MGESPILIAIDAEIIGLERRLTELHELRAQAEGVLGERPAPRPTQGASRQGRDIAVRGAEEAALPRGRVLDKIISALDAEPDGLTVAELARRIRSRPSTVSRVLRDQERDPDAQVAQTHETRIGSNGGRAAAVWQHVRHATGSFVLGEEEGDDVVSGHHEPEAEGAPAVGTGAGAGTEPESPGEAPAPVVVGDGNGGGDVPQDALREMVHDALIGSRSGAAGIAAMVGQPVGPVALILNEMVETGDAEHDGRVYWPAES